MKGSQFNTAKFPKKLREFFDPYYIAHNSLKNSLKDAKSFAKGQLLDIGCGKKPYFSLFSSSVENYIGIDLPRSRSKYVDIYASGLSLPVRSNVMDTVFCTEVLEHVPEPKELTTEVARVLKKGGYLILTAPQVWGLHEAPHDYYRYTRFGLKYLIEKSGLEVLEIKQTCGVFGVVGQRMSSFFFNRYNQSFFALAVILSALITHSFSHLDKAFHYEGDTLDNVVVARKV